ncbi:MAG: PHP domain-containing protein [Proteobacteria bacterium]|nr:PHP domain-containing protein [Pseudomonadota bacterium]MBU1388396.1 PHP domain-containing protein [Pseudomonadota bacterium]MBU1542780.1 PHP domain-containing protein [Pseudomonadota bacterium]MBU2430652.1 PHP domain-containing protein [Pseudomonadota bacterium]MBU2480141.1 PHP domain-containing protein [Pseudomonadota bacterium]
MFKIDMHIHSILGHDSIIAPDELVFFAQKAGMDAVCITEHHSFEISAPFDLISQKSGFPIIRGMEYKAQEGHLLVFGINMGRADMPPQMPMQHVIDWVADKGGIGIPAHPYQPDMFGKMLGDRLLSFENVVAVEAANGSASMIENKTAEKAADLMGWRKTGGSDAHGPESIGKAYTVFPHRITTPSQLVQALKTTDYYPETV